MSTSSQSPPTTTLTSTRHSLRSAPLVDLMLWTPGERPVRVSAVGNGISTEGTAFRQLDFVAAQFEFASGLVGRIPANFGSVQPHRHVVRAFGTEASFVSDDRGARL